MHTRLTFLPAASLAALTLLAGCKGRDDSANLPAADSARQGMAMVRVVNAAPQATTIDLLADDSAIFNAVSFKTVTPYRGIAENFVTFRLGTGDSAAPADSGEMATNREMMSDGNRYTVVALPGDSPDDPAQLMVLDEPNDAGTAGKARIRFVNAAQGTDEFDVFAPGREEALIDDVGFDSEAGYQELDPMTGSLEIRANDARRALLTIPSRTWEAGRAYTVIVVNAPSGRGLDAIVVEDQAGAMGDSGTMGRPVDGATDTTSGAY